jgi:hypothetical protein
MSGTGSGYYYDSIDGDVVHQNAIESLANVAVSYYYGPYSTQAEALAEGQKLASAGKGANPSANESVSSQLGNVADQSLLGGKLQEGDLIRIAQVLLGLVLIAVAAARITGAGNIVSNAVGAKIP